MVSVASSSVSSQRNPTEGARSPKAGPSAAATDSSVHIPSGVPEAHAAVWLLIHPAERLGQGRHGVGRHHGPAVGDAQDGAARTPAGRDPDPAARLVVPDRVVDQVPDHALDELLVAGRLGGREVRLHAQPPPGDARGGQFQGVLGHRREVEELAAGHALIADG